MPEPGLPSFNHVAVSVLPEQLNEEGRRDIVDFYSQVFDWKELTTETLDRKRLILGAYRLDQFVFIHADDEPMRAPRGVANAIARRLHGKDA